MVKLKSAFGTHFSCQELEYNQTPSSTDKRHYAVDVHVNT